MIFCDIEEIFTKASSEKISSVCSKRSSSLYKSIWILRRLVISERKFPSIFLHIEMFSLFIEARKTLLSRISLKSVLMGADLMEADWGKIIKIIVLLAIFVLAWAPWLDNKEIHDRVLRERGYKDGTFGWVEFPNGTRVYMQICDYKVHWVPFGRWVASCEGAYYVTFWGSILPP